MAAEVGRLRGSAEQAGAASRTRRASTLARLQRLVTTAAWSRPGHGGGVVEELRCAKGRHGLFGRTSPGRLHGRVARWMPRHSLEQARGSKACSAARVPAHSLAPLRGGVMAGCARHSPCVWRPPGDAALVLVRAKEPADPMHSAQLSEVRSVSRPSERNQLVGAMLPAGAPRARAAHRASRCTSAGCAAARSRRSRGRACAPSSTV